MFAGRCFRAIVLITGFSLCGCATFPQYRIPTAPPVPYGGTEPRPSVLVDLKAYNGAESGPGTPRIYDHWALPIARQAIQDSGLFSAVHFTRAAEAADCEIEINIYEHDPSALSMVSALTTMVTAGIVPGVMTARYTVRTTLRDGAATAPYRSSHTDDVHEWGGLAVLPWREHTIEKAHDYVIGNLVRTELKAAYDLGRLRRCTPVRAAAAR